jgi:tripartite-type tricarboxylate transporter receptor subunit TctC
MRVRHRSKTTRMTRRLLLIALTLVGLVPAAARAENYPSRTVTVVVPFPAGGSVDGVARIMVQKLNETAGQTSSSRTARAAHQE